MEIGRKVSLDKKLAEIILGNILGNAIKYTPAGGRVKLSIKKEDKNIKIIVSDTGYGIPKKQQGRIFEKLFRADNIKQKSTTGTGLGLYIVKSILDYIGGNIYFESTENKGSKFYITLPASGMKAREGSRQLE